MSNSYDQIATVDIEIASAAVDTTSFDNILIVGPAPAVAPETAPAAVGVYTSLDAVVEAGWVATGASADIVGVAAKIAFGQKPAPSKVFIAPMQTTTVENEGTTTTVTESALDTVKRAMNVSGWYVICPVGVENAQIDAIAEYVETVEKMMIYTDLTFFSSAGGKTANTTELDNTFYRTAAIFGKKSSGQNVAEVSNENKCLNVGFACSWLNYQSGSETAAFKQIAGIEPGEFSKTEVSSFDVGNCNYATEIGGRKVSMIGKVLAGEWMDIIRFRDWLKNEVQVSAARVFLNTTKVPYTDGGITLIQNAVEASLRRGQENGGIMEDEYDDDGNETLGFLVSAPKANSIPDVERQSRKLSGITFRARLAGAIHFTEIKGTVAYSL